MNANELRTKANRMLELADLMERAEALTAEIGGNPLPETPTVVPRRYVKFSPKEKVAFRRAWKAKVPVEQIMDTFGLTKSAVYSRAMNLGLGRRFPLFFAKHTNGTGAHV